MRILRDVEPLATIIGDGDIQAARRFLYSSGGEKKETKRDEIIPETKKISEIIPNAIPEAVSPKALAAKVQTAARRLGELLKMVLKEAGVECL